MWFDKYTVIKPTYLVPFSLSILGYAFIVIGIGEGGASKWILKEINKLNGIRSNLTSTNKSKECPITSNSKHFYLFHKKMNLKRCY